MNSIEVGADSTSDIVPQIADHVLIRRIGRGAYGEVWLAKNVMGGFRAVKVIYRRRFMSERPFECEFEGICKFEPISRLHPGLVTILHVGKNEQAGYFYCVMELADDTRTGQAIDTDAYIPRTLKQEMETHPHRPLNTSLQIALSLTSALGYLHARGLIHRDIKPSNIIFVNGVPKIADVGLVTEAGEDVSGRGTPFYMPSEGPGEPTADIFGLGKVFYELFMGLHPKHFPDLPGAAEEFTTVPELLRINNLILKACHHDPRQRFQTTNELHKALQAVAETVQKRPPGNGTMVTAGSDSAKPGAETPSKTTNIHPEKTTAAPEGRPLASGERPTARLSRRAALLIGVPTAVGGAFLLRKLVTPKEPTLEEKLHKWQVLYDLLDDKLACFMGYVGTVSPRTKFLIYSRGTDINWTNPSFRKKWVEDIEARFPKLTGRISTMEIKRPPNRTRSTFQNPETADEMRKVVKRILDLPERDLIPPPADPPALVLMDTTADRGVYDDENKGKGITNAEVLQKQLQDLPLKVYPVSISIGSSKRDWRGEQRVLALNPSLVIFHRSAFFHPVNAELDLGYPPF
jgi:serine/threonine protein kinase